MDIKVKLVVFLISLAWLVLVVKMLKRRRIWERYAILWVYVGVIAATVPWIMDLLDPIIFAIGVDEPPNFMLLLGLFAVLLLLLQFTMEITTLVRRTRNIVQDMAIIEERVRHLEDARARAGGPDARAPRPNGTGPAP